MRRNIYVLEYRNAKWVDGVTYESVVCWRRFKSSLDLLTIQFEPMSVDS
jgi:hypothetical protein